MGNVLNIPKVLPFWFVPNTPTPGEHLQDDWAYNQIRNWQKKAFYAQKWMRSYKTKLQIITTIAPDDLKLVNSTGTVVKSFAWTMVASGGSNGDAYECLFDVTTGVATDGYYYLYLKCELMAVKFEAISEPIYIKDYHRNVRPWVYKNSENAYGVVWTTGIEMTFMCESDIPAVDWKPKRDRNSYVDQIHNVSTTAAYPYELGKLYIGEASGVSPYIPVIANRIVCCDHVRFNGLLIETPENSEFDVATVKPFPNVAASIDVLPAKNLDSLHFNDESGLTPGVVIMYNQDTNFFGNGNVVRITEFEMT